MSEMDLRLKAMAKHAPSQTDLRQARNGQWRMSIWFMTTEDADFWHRIFKAVMDEAANGKEG